MPACLVVLNCRSGKKSRRGINRYRCPACKRTRSSSKRKTWQNKKWLVWFEKYILGGTTYGLLSLWSKYSIQTLKDKFHQLLLETPPAPGLPQITSEEAYLLLDGLWFGKRYCLMLYRQAKEKLLLHASFMAKEHGSLIAKDLRIFYSLLECTR